MNTNPTKMDWQNTPLQVYALEVISQQVNFPTPLLRADYHHIVLLEQGIYNQQIGIDKIEVKAPSLMYIPDGQAFGLDAICQEISGYLILIENQVLPSLFKAVELNQLGNVESVTTLSEELKKWFKNICMLLYEELTSSKPNRGVCNGLLYAFLNQLLAVSNHERSNKSRNYQIASSFKRLVNEYLTKNRSIDFYAQKLSISPNYLNRCVKMVFNKSCSQFLQETLILHSQILMFETHYDVSEISFMLGFDDPSYFSRVFKKVTEETPSQFKKRVLHGLS